MSQCNLREGSTVIAILRTVNDFSAPMSRRSLVEPLMAQNPDDFSLAAI